MGFPTWPEGYVAQPEPIDRDAFEYRRRQRAMSAAAGRIGRTASSLRDGANLFFSQREVRESGAALARVTQPALRAQLHLQRKGYSVYSASVIAHGLRGWIVGTRSTPMSDFDLIALAVAKGMKE